MSLTPRWRWTAELGGDVSSLSYHPDVDVLTVSVDDHLANGPAVCVLSAVDGTCRGTVRIAGTPSVSDDDAGPLFVTTSDDHVYAVDPASADCRWETQASTVETVVDDLAILRADRTLRAHRLDDGGRAWRTVLPDDVHATTPHGDTLVAKVGEFDDYGVVGVDAATGDEQWNYRPGDANRVTVGDAGIYLRLDTDDGYGVVRVDETTGAERWSAGFDRRVYSHPAEEFVYCDTGYEGSVVALDAATGREQWQSGEYNKCERIWVEDEAVYADFDTGDENSLQALDPNTGRTMWEATTDQDCNNFVLTDDAVYVGTWCLSSGGGTLYRLNRSTGSAYWTRTVGETIGDIDTTESPVLIRTYENTVYAVDDATGRVAWSFADDSLSLRTATDSSVVVSGADDVYVLDRGDRTVEHQVDDSNACTTGGGALFCAEGSTVEAYPLTDRPGAFEADPDTVVYGTSGAESDEDVTEVYDRAEGSGGGPDTACPSCGVDLEKYGDVNFCPECGADRSG